MTKTKVNRCELCRTGPNRKRKEIFQSQGMADRVAVRMLINQGEKVHAYRCPYGSGWHIGHPRNHY